MNALTPKEVADLRLWRPGEPGLIHVPFRLWQRILDALDGAPASAVEAAPEPVFCSSCHKPVSAHATMPEAAGGIPYCEAAPEGAHEH